MDKSVNGNIRWNPDGRENNFIPNNIVFDRYYTRKGYKVQRTFNNYESFDVIVNGYAVEEKDRSNINHDRFDYDGGMIMECWKCDKMKEKIKQFGLKGGLYVNRFNDGIYAINIEKVANLPREKRIKGFQKHNIKGDIKVIKECYYIMGNLWTRVADSNGY